MKTILKSLHFVKQCFSLYENKVLQLMPAGASLERFGKKGPCFLKSEDRASFKNEWTLN